MRKPVAGQGLQHQAVGLRVRPGQHDKEKWPGEDEQNVLRQLRLRFAGDTERQAVSAHHVRRLVHRRGALRHGVRYTAVRRLDLSEVAQST